MVLLLGAPCGESVNRCIDGQKATARSATCLPIYSTEIATPALWITVPNDKDATCHENGARRLDLAENPAPNTPKKQPPVESATTVPARESAFSWRNSVLKESLNDFSDHTKIMTPQNDLRAVKHPTRNCYPPDFISAGQDCTSNPLSTSWPAKPVCCHTKLARTQIGSCIWYDTLVNVITIGYITKRSPKGYLASPLPHRRMTISVIVSCRG